MFIIDPKKVIRLTLSYPASTGRNFDEILRCVPQSAPPCFSFADADAGVFSSSGSSIVRLSCSPTVVWFAGGALTASALKIALQIGDKYRVTTPVNWKKGDDVIVHPTVSNEEAKTLFPEFKIHKVSTTRTPAGDGAAGKDGSKRC